ncbi:MAG TPA: tetratricopeptide repeat protein [Cellvibrio sp.]|nr:tetratricopeptide repeat protein [Cellvibrio sp.]
MYSTRLLAQDIVQEAPPPDSSLTPLQIKLPERKFPADTLYSLLVAEVAGSRQQYDVALANYSQQARLTRDPQVAERATMIARYLNARDVALEMSLLWLDTAPRNKDALANASLVLMQAGRLQEAFEVSKRIKAQGGEPLFQNIAANGGSLLPAQREQLLQGYKNLLQRYSDDEQLLVGLGLLLQQKKNFNEAMDYAHRALKLYPRSIPAAALEANLLHELKRDDEAIAKMGAILIMYPDNTSLRNQYAHILTHYDMALAQQQFAILAEQLPNDASTLLSLGIVAMQRKDYKAANKAFERLLDFDQHASSAHYYLGQMAETQQNWPDAIYNYLQVESGNDFLPATISLLDIFIRKGDFLSAQQHMVRVRNRFPEQAQSLYLLHSQALIKHNYLSEAEAVLNESLQANPNNTQLLFARAMLYNKRRQLMETERDLNRILQVEPDNAIALNALGYMLTENKQRYREAKQLLNKALALKPDDPAIIDSIGWLHFLTGNYPQALQELRRAYALSPDPAIAAHLGEVLWVTGSFLEARKIWQLGIQQAPDDNTILTTMKRLKAN